MINGSVINGAPINAGASGAGPIVEDVLETAVITNPAETIEIYMLITDTAVVTGVADEPFTRWMVQRDTAALADDVVLYRTARMVVRDGIAANDATYVRRIVTLDVSETAVITGAASEEAPGVDVTDSAVVTSAPTLGVTKRLIVRDTAVVLGEALSSAALVVTDALVGTDTTYERTIARLDVRDTGVITGIDADDIPQDLSLNVRETAVVLGYSSNNLTARLDVNDTAYVSDVLVSSDGLVGTDGLPPDTTWTASVASWGMSRHSGVGITQRGTRFAVSPAGLYEIGTTYSAAAIDTGFMNFGTNALKHVSTLYLQGERDGDMTVTVVADCKGARASNSYAPIDRAQSDSRSVRIDIGRGYRSTYYKLQIATTGRAELFGGGVLVAPTERRI